MYTYICIRMCVYINTHICITHTHKQHNKHPTHCFFDASGNEWMQLTMLYLICLFTISWGMSAAPLSRGEEVHYNSGLKHGGTWISGLTIVCFSLWWSLFCPRSCKLVVNLKTCKQLGTEKLRGILAIKGRAWSRVCVCVAKLMAVLFAIYSCLRLLLSPDCSYRCVTHSK